MRTIFEQCPACGGPLIIRRVRCANCATEIHGEFAPGGFSGLTQDQLNFVKVFLRARGNLSEVEKTLGVSYPTIRNKLDGVVKALDKMETDQASLATDTPAASTPEADPERARILARIASGELSPSAGLDLLSRLPRP